MITSLVIGFLLFWLQNHNNNVDEKTVAILPLQNLSNNPDQIHLSDGISQDILANLSAVEDLQVISFNSSQKFRNSDKSVKAIGDTLGVKYILTGSVQMIAEKLRVRTMLINAKNDKQVWAKIYDGNLEDLFSIQTKVAQEIASLMDTPLTDQSLALMNQKPTENLDAYQAYSKGRHAWSKRTDKSNQAALKYFRQAIELDNNFALAYSGLAQTYAVIGAGGNQLPSEIFPMVIENAERALAIDSLQAGAYTALAAYYYDYQFEWEQAISYFQKALAINPNDPTARQWFAEAYFSKGDPINARKQINIARKLDPTSVAIKMVEVLIYIGEGKADEAEALCKNILTDNPANEVVSTVLFYLYCETNEMEIALKYLKESDPLQKHKHHWIEWYARQGQYNKLREYRTEVLELENKDYKQWLLDLINFKLLLEKEDYETYATIIDSFLFIKKTRNLIGQQSFPAPKVVRDHPRYQKMLKERGFYLIPRDLKFLKER